MITFGVGIVNDYTQAIRREWLITNGSGGYASGTVSGALTRRYHGLLIAALSPPLGRTLLVAKLEEEVEYEGAHYPLSTDQWASGAIDPQGYLLISQFQLIGTTPVWRFTVADALLEKKIWMVPGRNTTCVRYSLLRGCFPVRLQIKALVNYRDHHRLTEAGDWQMQVDAAKHGLRVTAFEGAVPYWILCDRGVVVPEHFWYYGVHLEQEAYRGLPATEDHFYAGIFTVRLAEGDSVTCTLSAESPPPPAGAKTWAVRRRYEKTLIDQANVGGEPDWLQQLILVADQFIVRRKLEAEPEGHTVIAGYPWFGDWGRDSMISLPGLALVTGRPEIARTLLRTCAGFVDQGMLPNRFPEEGQAPEYNSVDAMLWYFESLRAYLAETGDLPLLREVFPMLKAAVEWHLSGTRFGIEVDPGDGLLSAGEPGTQLTWMDARVGDWVVTPRIGKPVEVNALWYNALCSMGEFARKLGKPAASFEKMADRARRGFTKFWNAETGYCFDVIDGPSDADPVLRPNQVFAVSLNFSPLPPDRQKAIVDACLRKLYTPHGLRSLSPDEPGYLGHYGGDQRQRDAAYHQGTVWGWLLGPFVTAHLRVYADPDRAEEFLMPLVRTLPTHCAGNLSEIFDGDPPFSPRGCFAQAWTVAEVLRAWRAIQEAKRNES